MSVHTDEKSDIDSKTEQQNQLHTVPMPEDLAALSTEEYDAAGKRATRKVDVLVMPGVCILYKAQLVLCTDVILSPASPHLLLQLPRQTKYFCRRSCKH